MTPPVTTVNTHSMRLSCTQGGSYGSSRGCRSCAFRSRRRCPGSSSGCFQERVRNPAGGSTPRTTSPPPPGDVTRRKRSSGGGPTRVARSWQSAVVPRTAASRVNDDRDDSPGAGPLRRSGRFTGGRRGGEAPPVPSAGAGRCRPRAGRGRLQRGARAPGPLPRLRRLLRGPRRGVARGAPRRARPRPHVERGGGRGRVAVRPLPRLGGGGEGAVPARGPRRGGRGRRGAAGARAAGARPLVARAG